MVNVEGRETLPLFYKVKIINMICDENINEVELEDQTV